jgi:formylglycine-generating enzyme required for sulfatase activity
MPSWWVALFLLAGPEMVSIPAGEFQQGRSFEWKDYDVPWYPNPAKDDTPARRVKLKAYSLDVAEVTNQRYHAFVKATRHVPPYHWKKGVPDPAKLNHPVYNVSYDDAVAFCAWDGGKRLPTEAEWERAARGAAEGKMYPWGDRAITPADAVYDAKDGPQAVCGKTRHAFGLCDMTGNVWEWCADWYGQRYYASAPAESPPGPDTGLYRVLRGGSWFDTPPLFLSLPYRSWARPAERSPTIGFRCAK